MSAQDATINLPFRVEERTTTPAKSGKRPRPVWVLVGDTRGYDDAIREQGGRRWHGEWSFFEDPTPFLPDIVAAPATFAEQRAAAQHRAEARVERREAWADSAAAKTQAAADRSRTMLDAIPFGQPILVGHHSAGRDRRYRDRAQNLMARAVEEGKKAQEHQRRAAAAAETVAGDEARALGFCIRRRDEAQAEARAMRRRVPEADARAQREGRPPCSDATRERHERLAASYDEKAAYWQAIIDRKGGPVYGPAAIRKGDQVQVAGQWVIVRRVNPKSVTFSGWIGFPATMTWTHPYDKITGHRPATT
jgi:hypothetical protein